MELKLSGNEKTVLKTLIDDGRASDTSIAKKLKVSPQAVRKIRRKLEAIGVIKEYTAVIDYEKIGVHAFAIVQLKITGNNTETTTDLFENPNIIGSFRLPETNITNIFIAGFNSIQELDTYFAKLKQKYASLIEIQKINVFSNTGLMKNSPKQLLKNKIENR